MRRGLLKYLGLPFQLLPTSLLQATCGNSLIIPLYHIIADETPIHIKHLYQARSVKQFEQDLDYLLKHYKPIHPQDLIDAIVNSKQLSAKSMLLTFDDGLREFYDVAAPILLKKGIPAVNFLNSAFVDNKDLMHRYKASVLIDKLKMASSSEQKEVQKLLESANLSGNGQENLLKINYTNRYNLDKIADLLGVYFEDYLKKHQPYMSLSKIQELANKGFYFGAHSIDHPEFYLIGDDEKQRQINESVEFINKHLPNQPNQFAYPFTDDKIDASFMQKQKAFQLSFGTAGIKKDMMHNNLQRLPMEYGGHSGKKIVKTELLLHSLRLIFGKHIVKRR